MVVTGLEKFGWEAFFDEGFKPFLKKGYTPGRIAVQQKGRYTVYTALGELQGKVSGKMRYQAQGQQDLPTVGDWVVIRTRPEEGTATIHEILPRKSGFSRRMAGDKDEEQVIAANIDTAFLVSGLDGDYNLRRIERYLVVAWESKAQPVVILNKSDLCENVDQVVKEVEAITSGAPVLLTSAIDHKIPEQFLTYLKEGTTSVLLGSSGVGKSTLVNHLLGKETQRVHKVRNKDSHGRHTTTYRELLIMPSGALIIDTPGLRELQLWDVDGGMDDTFDDIVQFASQCRFRNCQHQMEPGCAVRIALEEGNINKERFNNFQKMQNEIAFKNKRYDLNAAKNDKAKRHQSSSAHKKNAERQR